ncbi:hypothetical protein [Allocoleopsis sp.]|uniref:hypothetical protein n=1 Tax=Allocoleopsis sp. TaxID=3088169 RepID=UPI002FD6EA91
MNPTQAVQRLEKHFSLVRDYWHQQKERGLGAIYLPLNGTLSYLTQTEIPDDTFGSLYAKLALGNPKTTNPNWTLVVIEIEKFPHPKFSWQLLAIDERGKIRTFNLLLGFRLLDTQTTVFLGRDRTIVEHQTPEGIESVSFSERGGES